MDSVLEPPEKHAYSSLCYHLNDTFLIFGHDLTYRSTEVCGRHHLQWASETHPGSLWINLRPCSTELSAPDRSCSAQQGPVGCDDAEGDRSLHPALPGICQRCL